MQTINYLPQVLQEIKEFKVLTACDDTVNMELNVSIDDLYNDQFITTTKAAINRYEIMLGITPKGADTLEDRRFRVLAVYNKQGPYNKTILEQNLMVFCGRDGYKLNIDYTNKKLIVKVELTAKSMLDTVNSYLEGVTPLNLVIDLSLLYNQNRLLNHFTNQYLSQYTHKQLREDVII